MSPPVKRSILLPNGDGVAEESPANPGTDGGARVLRTLDRYGEAPPPTTRNLVRLRTNFFGTNPSFGQRLPFPFDPSSLRYDANGRLEAGTLRREVTIHGARFPKGTRLHLHEDGSLRFGRLGAKQKVQGLSCGSGDIWFHPNGQISQVKLDRPQTIQGIHCDKGDAWFHDNGRLAQASLEKDQNIQGTPIRRGNVWFHRNSVLSQATLASTQGLRGLPLSGNETITFHQNGALRSATLSADVTVSGLPCRSGSVIWFHENRKLAQATLAEDRAIQGKAFTAGEVIRFRDDGALQ